MFFQAETEFDTTYSVNSNGELEGSHPTDVVVNKAASKSILRNKRTPTKRVIPKSSDMSSGAPAKILANRQLRVLNEDNTIHSSMILNASMANVDYARFDSLINSKSVISTSDVHNKVNLAQTIGGANLALCDGGANGCIKGNDMRVLYYNNDGRSAVSYTHLTLPTN